jgi:hypothetical protein
MQGMTRSAITDELVRLGFEPTPATLENDLAHCGIKPPPDMMGIGNPGDKAVKTREGRAARKIARLDKGEEARKIRDRRRFKAGPVPTGDYEKLAPATAKGTMFPDKVQEPTADTDVLIDGASNSKIGGDVSVGWLKGAHIRTLTLEERATCPATCPHWRGCYTNGMQWSVRWAHGPRLIAALQRQIPELLDQHEKLLVRLHVGGDFYSVKYVAFWHAMLAMHPRLFVFGFTEWGEDTEIGTAVARVRNSHDAGARFWVRKSNRTGRWGSFVLPFPTTEKTIADAIVCPEQIDARTERKGRHCGTCGACWSTDRPIAFVRH